MVCIVQNKPRLDIISIWAKLGQENIRTSWFMTSQDCDESYTCFEKTDAKTFCSVKFTQCECFFVADFLTKGGCIVLLILNKTLSL